jgi:curli biogenesis system outer membrane secretion channel CsgG
MGVGENRTTAARGGRGPKAIWGISGKEEAVRMTRTGKAVGPALVFFCAMLGGCQGPPVEVQIAQELRHKPSLTVAVLPFEQGESLGPEHQETFWMSTSIKGAGNLVSDMFTTELLRVPRFRVVERGQLKRILDEQDLSLSQLLAKKTAQEIGQLLGVEAVVLGNVAEFNWGVTCVPGVCGCGYSYSMRMVDTKTGTVLLSTQVSEHVGGDTRPVERCHQSVRNVVGKIIESMK